MKIWIFTLKAAIKDVSTTIKNWIPAIKEQTSPPQPNPDEGVNNLLLEKEDISIDNSGNIVEPQQYTITSELLRKKGLLEDYIWIFDIHYPKGLLVSENTILEMSEKHIDITEVARALFADKAFEEYEQLISSVQKLHDEKIALAEQVYNKALGPADKIFDEKIDQLDNECGNAIEAAEKIFKETIKYNTGQNQKIYQATLTMAQKVYDNAIEKATDIYDAATNMLEEDYNGIMSPANKIKIASTIEEIRLYNRTKAIGFVKSWALKK